MRGMSPCLLKTINTFSPLSPIGYHMEKYFTVPFDDELCLRLLISLQFFIMEKSAAVLKFCSFNCWMGICPLGDLV